VATQQESIRDDPLRPAKIRLVSPVLREQNPTTSPCKDPAEGPIEKRGVLMSLNQVDTVLLNRASDLPGAACIESLMATQDAHKESFTPQLLAQCSQLVETKKDEAVAIAQLPGQPRRQDFRASDL
jgi:hypothetical protein